MKPLLKYFVVLLFVASPWVAAEAPMGNLYQARVPLADRSNAAQQAAISQGLAQVLIKVSGFSGTPNFTGVADELPRADRYLLDFAIESARLPIVGGVGTQNGEALWMRFNQELIDALVRRWEIPVWPSSRPQIALALEVTMAGEKTLLNGSNYPAVEALLSQQASARGVHLQLLSTQSGAAVLAAAAVGRLPPYDYWGKIELQQDRFGQIQVALNTSSSLGESRIYSGAGQSLSRALAAAFDQFVDAVSMRSSFVAGGAGGNLVTLEILGIGNFESYRRALDSLNSLEMVDEARVLQLDLDRVQVRVKLASNLALLVEAIRQQGILVTAEGSGVATSVSSTGTPLLQLRYRGSGP